MGMKIVYVEDESILTNQYPDTPGIAAFVCLAEVDALIQEAVWAMELVFEQAPMFSEYTAKEMTDRSQAFLDSPVVAAWRDRQEKQPVVADLKQTVRRSCNLHQDCDVADPEGKKCHCHVEDCEDCYGQ